ncbi:MAG TPA: histidine kinase [Solirubrobacteraceae bacterium]|nr:histidine kinase [Solirubrobacteraceae bacterium]
MTPGAIWACAGALALTGAVAMIGLDSSIVDRPAVFVTLRIVFSVGLVLVALMVFARASNRRLGWFLVAIAATFALTGLTAADSPVAFAVGRATITLALLLIVYFCLGYPSCRIEQRIVSVGFAATAAVLVVLDVSNLLLSHVPPVAGPFTRCSGSACPPNPFAVLDLGPGPSRGLSAALGIASSGAVFAAGIVAALRAVDANRLRRRSRVPVFAWTLLAGLGYGSFIIARLAGEYSGLLTPMAIIVATIIAMLPLAITVGLVWGRVFAHGALETMIAALGEHPNLLRLQRAMSRALADPKLQLLLWRPSARDYSDVDGVAVELADLEQGRTVTEFTRDGEPIAAAVHDQVLAGDRSVLEAAGTAICLALDNERLRSDLSTSIRELEASRKRLAWAADEERRRIERDLHDGVQQDLIALRIKLGALQDLAGGEPASVARGIADASKRVDTTLQHIRNLAKGIYPSVLRDLGLSHALAAVAREMPMQVSLRGRMTRRYAPEVETAVYFSCLEALQNVAKHCGSEAHVRLQLSDDHDRIAFTLADDGPGFDPTRVTTTHGITGMRDRLEAIGGTLAIHSSARGTIVTGRVPAHEI